MPEDDWEDITSVEQLDFAKAGLKEENEFTAASAQSGSESKRAPEDDDWLSAKPVEEAVKSAGAAKGEEADEVEEEEAGGEPMFIINLTLLSDGKIHSKFDRHSVNDTDAAMALRREVSANFEEYASKKELIEGGVVKPCSTSVWKAALAALRDEYSGHYFAPIFPPKSA